MKTAWESECNICSGWNWPFCRSPAEIGFPSCDKRTTSNSIFYLVRTGARWQKPLRRRALGQRCCRTLQILIFPLLPVIFCPLFSPTGIFCHIFSTILFLWCCLGQVYCRAHFGRQISSRQKLWSDPGVNFPPLFTECCRPFHGFAALLGIQDFRPGVIAMEIGATFPACPGDRGGFSSKTSKKALAAAAI